MDEDIFLSRLASVSRDLTSGVGDIRAKVWERLATEERARATDGETVLLNGRWFLASNIAATVVLVLGAAAAYSVVTGMFYDMYWDGSLLDLLMPY